MANGISKNPSFLTDFKKVNLILVKSAPKKLFCQMKSTIKIGFWGKTFFGGTFYLGRMHYIWASITQVPNVHEIDTCYYIKQMLVKISMIEKKRKAISSFKTIKNSI
jgi:hypothetical protein